MIKFVWTTYRWDAGCCLQSVKSVLDLGISPKQMVVYVQDSKPLLNKDEDEFRKLGVKLEIGQYARRDTLLDVVSRFSYAANTDFELAWLLDSDVVVNDLSSAEEVLNGGYAAGACSWEGCEFSGCSMLIRPEVATQCIMDIMSDDSANIRENPRADDVKMGLVLDALYPEKVKRWCANDLGWYLFKENWADMEKKRWVHFGQKNLACRLTQGRSLVREVIETHMKSYREWRKSKWTNSQG